MPYGLPTFFEVYAAWFECWQYYEGLRRRQVRVLKFGGVILLMWVAFAISAAAQTECPADRVCISREAALKALADADRVKALEVEIKVKDEAVASFRDELNKMRIEFARVSGEATALKTNAVRDAAIIELLLKYARPKKFGLINLF